MSGRLTQVRLTQVRLTHVRLKGVPPTGGGPGERRAEVDLRARERAPV
ncbi:hypothetical protein [Streptomyces sp. NPDC096152]